MLRRGRNSAPEHVGTMHVRPHYFTLVNVSGNRKELFQYEEIRRKVIPFFEKSNFYISICSVFIGSVFGFVCFASE